jgi:hypothetical protein
VTIFAALQQLSPAGAGYPSEVESSLNPKSKIMAALIGTGLLATAGLVASRARSRSVERRSPAAGRFITVDGVRLHVLQRGAGPDVLLIHGAAMMADEMMLALSGALAGCRVTAIDRPGHGHSDQRRRPSVIDQATLFHAAATSSG